jgi:hypothetical protein
MSENYDAHSIYLYKPSKTENITNTWVYYRIDSIDGPTEPGGTLLAPIQMCKVSWPTFADILPMTDIPGVTGLESAYDHMCRLAKGQWGVEHENSTFIGFLEYEVKRSGVLTTDEARAQLHALVEKYLSWRMKAETRPTSDNLQQDFAMYIG